jgi:hypothetical protein
VVSSGPDGTLDGAVTDGTIVSGAVTVDSWPRRAKYRRSHPPVPRPREFSIPIRREALTRAGNKCERCGSGERLQVDHILAIVDGGEPTLENARVLCQRCHVAKTRRDLRRRQGYPRSMVGEDLRDYDLCGANLAGCDLSQTDLSGSDLSGASLAGATLVGACLSRANLTRANLTRANLQRTALEGVDLTDAVLRRARFRYSRGLTLAQVEYAVAQGASGLIAHAPKPRAR